MPNAQTGDTNWHEKVVAPIQGVNFDLARLREAVYKVIQRFPFDQVGQLCLTSPSATDQSPYFGTGSLFNFQTSHWIAREKDFIHFNKALQGSYLFETYQRLQETLPWNIGRVRIMKLEPKRCYSFHNDLDFRIHIAIDTDPQCFLIFYPGPIVHIPADGLAYFTNTLRSHTAMNGGHRDRIHLVFSTYE